MTAHKILFSNLGYARGIDGRLDQHIRYAHRHVYCPPRVQLSNLKQLEQLIAAEDPDLCCLVEIDAGSFSSGRFNQLTALLNAKYGYFAIDNKYGQAGRFKSLFLPKGKSNAFIAKQPWPHEKIYFTHGVKRLIYKITLEQNLTLFFAHFSLRRATRTRQLLEIGRLARAVPGEVIILGDFNILKGTDELAPLMQDGGLVLLNRKDTPTFHFHDRQLLLDLCLCSPRLAEKARLKIAPQAFSDHAALILEIQS